MPLDVGELVIVEAGAAQQPVFHREAERLHQMQRGAGVGREADDVAGVGRNLRLDQDDVEHGASSAPRDAACGRRPRLRPRPASPPRDAGRNAGSAAAARKWRGSRRRLGSAWRHGRSGGHGVRPARREHRLNILPAMATIDAGGRRLDAVAAERALRRMRRHGRAALAAPRDRPSPGRAPGADAGRPRAVLDWGAGPGGGQRCARQRYPKAESVAVEPDASWAARRGDRRAPAWWSRGRARAAAA